MFLQVFCGSNSGSLFFSAADGLPNQGIPLHLRVIAGNGSIQRSVHVAVISGFTNIHGFPLSVTRTFMMFKTEKSAA